MDVDLAGLACESSVVAEVWPESEIADGQANVVAVGGFDEIGEVVFTEGILPMRFKFFPGGLQSPFVE